MGVGGIQGVHVSQDGMDREDDGLEIAACYLEERARDIRANAATGSATAEWMAKIFEDEANAIRSLKNQQFPAKRKSKRKA
jgi:hypothetical protein